MRAIEQAAIRNKTRDYRYILIRQIKPEDNIIAYSKTLKEHCLRIVKLRQRFEEEQEKRVVVDLLKVSFKSTNSFMIIDGKIIVVFMNSNINESVSMSGILVLFDKHRKVVKKFRDYFGSLERMGKQVEIHEVEDTTPQQRGVNK